MPQPFPRNLENPQLQIGDASKQRPDLFMRGMAVIAHHSQVDAVLNTLRGFGIPIGDLGAQDPAP